MPRENIDPKLEKRIQKSMEAHLRYHEKKAGGGPRRAPKKEGRPRRRFVSDDPDAWEDDDFAFEPPRRKGRPSKSPTRPASRSDLETGTLISISHRRGTVRSADGEELIGHFSVELAAVQSSELAIGDDVRFERCGEVVRVVERCARRTELLRPDPRISRRGRVIVANVDVIGVVAAIQRPPLRPGLIDRYLIAIERGGARPLIVLNKVDLASEAERNDAQSILEPYRSMECPIIECSAETGEGIAELRAALRGQRVAFVGHSGVGKSSITNALDPSAELDVGSVADFSGKGRHTTTSSLLVDLGDFELIDTPGIREFGLFGLTAMELDAYFHDFDEFRQGCQFSSCSHRDEPRCGVREAVQSGLVNKSRYEAYLNLRHEIES